jgi:hypothetical protein
MPQAAGKRKPGPRGLPTQFPPLDWVPAGAFGPLALFCARPGSYVMRQPSRFRRKDEDNP